MEDHVNLAELFQRHELTGRTPRKEMKAGSV
jgi:hypothetical protein